MLNLSFRAPARRKLARPALALALVLPALTHPLAAQPFSEAEARGLLFAPDRVEVARYPMENVSDEQIEILMTAARMQQYYAALAYAPGAGIMAEPTVMASNYHSPEAARAAALQQCNARRQGGARCQLALEVRPTGWQTRQLSLSAEATAAVGREYRRISGPRALAASQSGGAWAIARGDAAETQALAVCNDQAPADDCRVLLRD